MDKQLPMHLAIRPLNLSDLDQVCALEQLSFAPAEAASPDAIRYRLTVAPELSSGLFVRSFGGKYSSLNESSGDKGLQNSSGDKDQNTSSNKNDSNDNDSNNDSHGRNSLALDGSSNNNNDYSPDEKSSIINERLIGHILSTKMHSEFVDELAMQVPQHFLKQSNGTRAGAAAAVDDRNGNKKEEQQADESKVGHVESSDVIGMHSVAVHPDFRGKKIGTLILHDYIQKLSNQQVASVISILAKPDMLGFYEKLGFEDKGVSQCKHGGEEWHDLQILLTPEEDKL